MGSFHPFVPDLQSIIAQLTVEEKISLLAGADFWTTNPIPRLGIPPLKFSDGPNGARGGSFNGGPSSACFPASVSLASTFDRDLLQQIGRSLAEETKTKGAHVLLGPTVCPHRDPRGGRNFESFSEDPFLAGELASYYILGLQKEGIAATIKHFAVNEQETRRFTINACVSQRALREIYLKPFEIAVKKSDPWAVMTSYNLINGIHADANTYLLTDILRDQWGFKGLIMSDWGGTNSVAQSLNAGHDLEMPGPPLKRTLSNVISAIKSGEVTEEVLNQRVKAVLGLLQQTGRFEHPEIQEETAVDRLDHRQIIRRAGAEGMVLLKNENAILPLQKNKLKSIAMIGLAKQYLGHGGGSAAVNSHHKTTPYAAFEELLGDSVELRYAEGARIIRNLPVFEPTDVLDEEGNSGFTLGLLRSSDVDGKPSISNVKSAQVQSINFPDLTGAFLVGTYKPRRSAIEYISFTTIGFMKVSINDETVFTTQDDYADVMAFVLGIATDIKIPYTFVAGQEYKIRVEAKSTQDSKSGLSLFAGSIIGFRIGKMLQEDYDTNLLDSAIEVAKNSDVALVFVGNTPAWETEGYDRDSINLPKDGSLDQLIASTANVNPNTIVINSTGSPIAMPWLSEVAAVLQTWFPGQEAGYAIADVVFGATNPGGKLPVTFPKAITYSPSYPHFPGDIQIERVDYTEGVYIGYRHYDQNPEGVLFPFGYGLSYSTFELSNAKLSGNTLASGSTVDVSVDIKNTGALAGSEVVQVYVGAERTTEIDRPIKVLAGFTKVNLQVGESQRVTVTINQEGLAYWAESKDRWAVDSGRYKIFVGTSSIDIAAILSLDVTQAFDYGA